MTGSTGTDGPRPRLGRLRDWLIGGLLLAAVVLGVALTVGWGDLLAPWLSFPPLTLALVVGLAILSYFLRAVRVHDYFRPRFDGRFLTVLRLSVMHNAANNLLPMRVGELVFPWLMRRWLGQGFLGATASLIWIRLLDLHFLGLIGIFVLYVREPHWIWPLAGFVWLALVPLAGWMGRLAPAGEGRLTQTLRLMTDAAPVSSGRVLRIYFWTALTWGTKLLAFAVVLRHFLPAELWLVMLGVMGAELSSVLPFHGIAGGGSYELAAMAALVPLGVSPEAALAGAVNLHLFLLGITLLLGLAALLIPVQRAAVETSEDI